MINAISKVWGIITLIFAVICLFPFLGWGNWFVIIFAIIGIIMGSFAQQRGGLYLNLAALFLAFFRLIFGGGLI